MLVAAGLPLFGCIAALCGNRFFGFVSVCVAGMFGMTGILLGFFFSAQYFVSFVSKNDHILMWIFRDVMIRNFQAQINF